jgi:uncharacterized membrane protein YciS (DUF1049 family)
MLKQFDALTGFVALVFISSECIAAETPKPTTSATAAATATPGKTAKVSASDNAAAFKDVPTQSLQRQADKLTDKIEALQNSITEFTDYADRVIAVEKGLPAGLTAEAIVKVTNVANAFNVLKAAKADENVASSTPGTVGANFSNALAELQFILTSSFNEAMSKVVPSFNVRLSLGPSAHVPTPAEQLAEDAASGVADPRRAHSIDKFMPKLAALATALYRVQLPGQSRTEVKRSVIDAEINAAQPEAADLQALASQAFGDCAGNYKKVLDAVVNRVQDEILKLKETMGADNKQLADINPIIASRSQDIGTRQNTLTGVLFNTELLMIGAIAIAIIFLRIYSSQLAVTIVQERTLGDMLGMGLLLITVIFLSTGEFIDKSAVVTLLGTIAGYIFARPSRAAAPSTLGTASAATQAPPPAPRNLQETLPRVPGQASVSCNPVPGAIAYRWYAKLLNAPGDPMFRQQTTQPHAALSGFQAGDKVVIAVTATNGQESPFSAPLTVTIT